VYYAPSNVVGCRIGTGDSFFRCTSDICMVVAAVVTFTALNVLFQDCKLIFGLNKIREVCFYHKILIGLQNSGVCGCRFINWWLQSDVSCLHRSEGLTQSTNAIERVAMAPTAATKKKTQNEKTCCPGAVDRYQIKKTQNPGIRGAKACFVPHPACGQFNGVLPFDS
jgi:hypothetical protein